MQYVLSALCQEEDKGAAAKIFMCARSDLSSLSFPEMSVLSWENITLLCSPQISAWGRNVRPSGGVRGFGLLGDYPCSCSAALHAWCSRADAEAQHPSWQAQVGHTTST